jgi:glycosyltransferase involved in cell wall biosynthesis
MIDTLLENRLLPRPSPLRRAWGQESPPLLVFADDWGRHPSSCQHLIRHLLDRHEVYWINTIGTRTPRFDLDTLSRGLEKIRHWTAHARDCGNALPRLHVVNPRMWPWFSSSFGRRVNRELLYRQLLPLLRTLPRRAVAITTFPLVSDLIGVLPVKRWVYYCVDDFGEWPGLDQYTLRAMEKRLVDEAEVLIAVSATLQHKLAEMGRNSFLLTHGVDLDHWQSPDSGKAIPFLKSLKRPLVVFWGAIDQRLDVDFVRQLATDLSKGTILLVGPEASPDPRLFESSRVVRLAALEYEQLPTLASEAAVLIMPYADLPVTQAIQPLKLKEYLATNKPAVVRDLPATRSWAGCLDLVSTPKAFSRAVQLRLCSGLPKQQHLARNRLQGESWVEKATAFEYYIGA